MTALPLTLGPLRADGFALYRSGVRWLVPSGQRVRAGQVIGYCNVKLEPNARLAAGLSFADELELQVAFAARIDGRVALAAQAMSGGYLDLHGIKLWSAEETVGEIEPAAPETGGEAAGRLRLLALAGRRMTALADVHSGLMPGWLGRIRGWWCEEDEAPVTLLSLGICDATGVVLGAASAFFEMFEHAPFPAQMVFVPDHPLAPAAPVLLDQLRRTPAEMAEIAADLQAALHAARPAATAEDHMMAGALLATMRRSPLTDSYPVFTGSGSRRLGPATAVLLSLNAEPQVILRHRRLGYRLHMLRHHQAAAGPALRQWLAAAFEPVRRSVEDIRRDYAELIDTLGRETGARVLILNRMSTSGLETVSNYAAFDAPLGDTLANVASKELNLMLEDLAETHPLQIVDVDAIAADLGGAEHLPDGVHQSSLMQTAIRGEILAALRGAGREAPRLS
ncbi:hypothetical protein GCM10011390_32610 [Aureimonas endophytica]|uniref:Uncharacterized protein n=1 Tax=Aureimonas endophytica TaxID=2027858 RepID=A0A916ZRS0_9HYPH|nr:hypothetical protein [Aureimonas endophytica]GGE11028.1 hypothetical protein GCM10011390_32610 [Aureimonas endophytica]